MKKLTRIELQGGLGNQLFIWAMAHHIATLYKVHVEVIVSTNKKTRKDRPCEIFALGEICNHNISIRQSKVFGYFTKTIDKISKLLPRKSKRIFSGLRIVTLEKPYDIYTDEPKHPRILRGYFQSLEIPEGTKMDIFTELKSHLDLVSLPGILRDRKEDVVAHIRRGDTKNISEEWGVLSLDYYKNLIPDGMNLTICTDEKDNTGNIYKRFSAALILGPEESSPWQVLKIISKSKVFIMANSTLSWWGAWIAKNDHDSTIYFPDPWRPNNIELGRSLKWSNVRTSEAIFEEA